MYLNSFRYVSDFADVNLWQWLKRDADAFDWSPYFSCVVEGKWEEGSEQQELQFGGNYNKAVVYCDITQGLSIEKGYGQEYDVLMSSLCAEVASQEYFQMTIKYF